MSDQRERTNTGRAVARIWLAALPPYVKEGLASPDDPFKQQLREWVFGSEDFLRRMAALAEGTDRRRRQSTS